MPTVPSHCGCQECSAAFEGPSMILPVQYNRMKRSPDDPTDDRRAQRTQQFQDRINGHIETLRAIHGKTADKYEKTKQYAVEQVSKIKSKFQPYASRSREFVQGFFKNFEKPVAPRERRSVTETPNTTPLMPMLKVVENQKPSCPVIQDLKENSEFRSRIAQPDVLQYMPEVGVNVDDETRPTRCPLCHGAVSDSVCLACARAQQPAQPQYFRYVNGTPEPFVPGMGQSAQKRSAQSNFFVYDRFGHKYEENNGNLRLLAPEFGEDPQIGQPNIEAFSRIMNDNAEVMHDVNPFPGSDRMISPVTDIAADGLDFIHDMARREAVYPQDEASSPLKRPYSRKSHYQIIPIRHENRKGSLISKLSSNDDRIESSKSAADRKDGTEEKPSLQKITKNNNQYEILTIDTHQSEDSAEEFDRIMKFLHSGRI